MIPIAFRVPQILREDQRDRLRSSPTGARAPCPKRLLHWRIVMRQRPCCSAVNRLEQPRDSVGVLRLPRAEIHQSTAICSTR